MHPSDHPACQRRASVLLIVLLSLTAALALLAYGLTGFLRLSRDARCLRDTLTSAPGSTWDEKFEGSIGPITTSLIRAGSSFVELDPEARAALRAVRAAEVGVYQSARTDDLDRGRLLAEADEAMARRGWERLVAVVEKRELVAVYVPKTGSDTRKARACLAVLDGHQLVIASAQANLEPLLQLAMSRPEWKERQWLPDELRTAWAEQPLRPNHR